MSAPASNAGQPSAKNIFDGTPVPPSQVPSPDSTTAARVATTSPSESGQPAQSNVALTEAARSSEPGNQGNSPEASQTPQTPQTPTPSQSFDPKMVQEIVTNAVKATQPAAQEQPRPQITQEEFDKQFSVAKVAPEDMEVLSRGGEPALATMNELLQRSSRQAVTMAHYVTQQLIQQFKQELSPYVSFGAEMRAQHYKNQFFNQHPDLKDFEPIVVEVTKKLESSGLKGTPEVVFKQISDEARRLIAAVNKQQLPPSQGGPQTNQPTAKMTPLSTGGQAGAGSSSQTSGSKSTAKSIFG